MSNAADMRAWPAGASPRYVAARERLLEAERDLLDRVKRVAELRRALPPGAAMPTYAFAEGPRDLTRAQPVLATTLVELVGDRGLFVYHLMFAPDWDEGCPSCSMWVDGLHGVAHHLAQVTSFAVIAKAPLPKLRAWARHRGWSGLRLLSSHGTTLTPTSAPRTPTEASGRGPACSSIATASSTTTTPPRTSTTAWTC
jgi:predicted dithiol-disulfide oxidoreductase (DUF899 family)